MKQCQLFLVVLLQIVPGLMFSAEEPATIDCEQIVRAAVEHSVILGVSDQELRAVKAKGRQVTAQGLPSLDLEIRAGRYQGLEDIVLGPVTIPFVENRYGVAASILQPVYTGNRLSSLAQNSILQEKAATSVRDGVRADVVLQARTAYWGWAKAFQSLSVLDAAVARMTEHAADVRHMNEAGLVTDSELLATEVLVDRTRLALEQAQRQVDRARVRIIFITGMELASNSVPDCVMPDGIAGIPEEGGLLGMALSQRPERTARDIEVSASKELAKAARGALYPQAYLTARYEQANPNLLNIPPVDEWKGDAFVGVSVSWNIFDWGFTQAKAEEADSRIAQAKLRLRQQEEQITLEVRENCIALRDALERVALSSKALKSASLSLDAARDLWKNGVARHAEVLDAHARLTEVQFEAVVARADVILARAALSHATGQTGMAQR
ncbi:MAG: TolC family protein [bacterium]